MFFQFRKRTFDSENTLDTKIYFRVEIPDSDSKILSFFKNYFQLGKSQNNFPKLIVRYIKNSQKFEKMSRSHGQGQKLLPLDYCA